MRRYPRRVTAAPPAPGSRPLPDFTVVHKELKGPRNVTLQLLGQEHHQANAVFVTVVGSSYAYAEATRTLNLCDWCGSHVRSFEYLQGTSRLIVPERRAKTCYYEAELNRTYKRT